MTTAARINQICDRMDALPTGTETRVLNRLIGSLRTITRDTPHHPQAVWTIAEIDAALASLEHAHLDAMCPAS